jgi:hypothetical protein
MDTHFPNNVRTAQHAAKTEEENNGYVVFKLDTIQAGNRSGEGGGITLPLFFLQQVWKIFKDDVNDFPPSRLFASCSTVRLEALYISTFVYTKSKIKNGRTFQPERMN